MALTAATTPKPSVGDTTPCSTCGHVNSPEKRLHEIACCGLDSHAVRFGFSLMTFQEWLGHLWRDTGVYSAVLSDHPISEDDALAWLERAHAGETKRRPVVTGAELDFDRWQD